MDALIVVQIDQETKRAVAKYGRDSVKVSSWERAALILNEESGEVSQAVLDMTRPIVDDVVRARKQYKDGLQRVFNEALQTASVAVRIMDRCRLESERIELSEREVSNVKA